MTLLSASWGITSAHCVYSDNFYKPRMPDDIQVCVFRDNLTIILVITAK
jgi:hypothetical protein